MVVSWLQIAVCTMMLMILEMTFGSLVMSRTYPILLNFCANVARVTLALFTVSSDTVTCVSVLSSRAFLLFVFGVITMKKI